MAKFTCHATFTREDGSHGTKTVDVDAAFSDHASSKVADQLIKEGHSPREITTWKRPNS